MKKKYKDYADYLKSDKWKQVKADYAEYNQVKECLICTDDEAFYHFHHWNYPNDWNNDSHENLLFVCETCHKDLHSNFFDHGNDIISLKDYLKSAYAYFHHKSTCDGMDMDSFILANTISKVDAEVVLDSKTQPIRVNIKEPITINQPRVAIHLL